MKNILFGVIAVLVICIGILFYQVQGLKKAISGEETGTEKASENNSKKPVIINTASGKLPDAKIAYINIDSLNENYLFISDYVKVLKNKRIALETQMQSMTAKFQEDYQSAQQSAQAGLLPAAEMENKKRDLERQQKELENKQIQMDKLAVDMQEKNEQLQRDVKSFLTENYEGKYDFIMAYSNAVPTILLANPKLEITHHVLDALNENYKNSKSAKK
ncbi:MAG TPA: OmpH family outer membrane protein [Bacteroidia bacterium]|jgi:outer membrane protein|nr:OmpH family outer membrane protein [Bacteroidia bacterium]